MGGLGSGNRYHRWRSGKKTVVEDCLHLDAARWMREGVLRGGVVLRGTWRWTYPRGQGFTVNYEVDTLNLPQPFVRLWYSWIWTATQQQDSAEYPVRLVTTRPRFGGLRWWFICPLVVNGQPCGRRVGKLYLPPTASYFGCRHCHELTYTSCQKSHKDDAMLRYLAAETGRDFATVKRLMKRLEKRGDDSL